MKRIKILKYILIFVFCVISYKLQIARVYAQHSSLSISPPIIELIIKPGKSVLVAYKLINYGDPTVLKSKVVSFSPKDNLGGISLKEYLEGPIRFELDNANLQLNDSFFLKTRDYQQLLLRIRAPEGAPEGDYYYTLLTETQPPPTLEGVTTSKAKAVIGSNILITVTSEGNVDILGKVALFDVIPRYRLNFFGNKINLFDSNDRIPVVLVLENKGKNMIKPQGEIILSGKIGEKSKYEILPQNVLAESQRLLTTKELMKTRYSSLELSGFFIGSYKISTTINFGENSPNIYASTSFVALPFRFLIGLFIAALLTVIIVKIYKRNSEE